MFVLIVGNNSYDLIGVFLLTNKSAFVKCTFCRKPSLLFFSHSSFFKKQVMGFPGGIHGHSGIRHQVSGIRYHVSGITYQVSGIMYQVSGIRYQVSGVRCQVSGMGF